MWFMQNTHNTAAFGALLPHERCTQSSLDKIPVLQLKTVYFLLQHPGSIWAHVTTWLPWEIWFVLEVHRGQKGPGIQITIPVCPYHWKTCHIMLSTMFKLLLMNFCMLTLQWIYSIFCFSSPILDRNKCWSVSIVSGVEILTSGQFFQ